MPNIPEPPPQANIPEDVRKRLQEQYNALNAKHGDKFQIDWDNRLVKPKGWQSIKGNELQKVGQDLWKNKFT